MGFYGAAFYSAEAGYPSFPGVAEDVKPGRGKGITDWNREYQELCFYQMATSRLLVLVVNGTKENHKASDRWY